MKDDAQNWKLVSPEQMTLNRYPCGVVAGDRLRLRHELMIQDPDKRQAAETHSAGEIWTVLCGNPCETDCVWLRQPNGKEHTWDERYWIRLKPCANKRRIPQS